MGWKLAYVTLCLAGMAAFYAGVRWLIYGISSDFGIGVGVGFALGMSLMFLAHKYDQRANSRPPARTPSWPRNDAP